MVITVFLTTMFLVFLILFIPFFDRLFPDARD